ncbi:MAG: hypothetical protein ACHQ1D_01555 [Nitrososphaerales archaeon]
MLEQKRPYSSGNTREGWKAALAEGYQSNNLDIIQAFVDGKSILADADDGISYDRYTFSHPRETYKIVGKKIFRRFL